MTKHPFCVALVLYKYISRFFVNIYISHVFERDRPIWFQLSRLFRWSVPYVFNLVAAYLARDVHHVRMHSRCSASSGPILRSPLAARVRAFCPARVMDACAYVLSPHTQPLSPAHGRRFFRRRVWRRLVTTTRPTADVPRARSSYPCTFACTEYYASISIQPSRSGGPCFIYRL
jgi:hypothetical protein